MDLRIGLVLDSATYQASIIRTKYGPVAKANELQLITAPRRWTAALDGLLFLSHSRRFNNFVIQCR